MLFSSIQYCISSPNLENNKDMPLHLIFHTALKVGFYGEVHSSSKYLFSYYFPHYHLNLASLHSGLTRSKAFTLAIPWAQDTVAPEVFTCLLSHFLQGFACVHENCLETLISTYYTNHLLFLLLCSAFYSTYHFLMVSVTY